MPRRRLVRTAVVAAALAVPVVAVAPPRALADCILDVLTVTREVALEVGGGPGRLTVTLGSNCDQMKGVVTIAVPMTDQGVRVKGASKGCAVAERKVRCEVTYTSGGDSTVYVDLAPPTTGGPPTGESRKGTGEVMEGDGCDPCYGTPKILSYGVTLRGFAQIAEVAGTVLDSGTSKPVVNAVVRMVDGDDREHRTATNKSGEFRLRPGGEHPLTPGSIRLTVVRDGYQIAEHTQRVGAGKKAGGIRVALRRDVPAAVDESPAASAPPRAASGGGGAGWWPYLLVGLGVLALVAAVVAIVVLFRGRASADPGTASPPGRVPADPRLGDSTLIDIRGTAGGPAPATRTAVFDRPDGGRGRHARREP